MSINKRAIESLEDCRESIQNILEDYKLEPEVKNELEELKMFLDIDIKDYKSELGWE